jgi:hypothetical protein
VTTATGIGQDPKSRTKNGHFTGSYACDILPENRNKDLDTVVLNIQCTLAGKNPFGRVCDGTIRLRGYVKAAILQLPNALSDPVSGRRIGRLRPDENPGQDDSGQVIWCILMTQATPYWSYKDRRIAITSPEQFCGDLDDRCTYLALRPTGLREREFRRIGLAVLDKAVWDGDEKKEITIV